MNNFDGKEELMKIQFTESDAPNFNWKEEWARIYCELNTWETPKEYKNHPFWQENEVDPVKIFLREQMRHNLMIFIERRIGEKVVSHYWNVKFKSNGMSEKEFKKFWFWRRFEL
jgi:hypothetical protein